ncbi:hypothetical protein F5Y18DRAFT_161064 [Xylariaceae sp. FL1019]|nr:hypothetical protein F5Y18DRAFT_161064 [Xylariaceae sp. FL1019]
MADNEPLRRLTPTTFKDTLNRVIEDSASSSAFACSKSNATFPNPGLSILDYGDVGLPLAERDAKAIIAHCHKSPFGKGAETLVDDNVRRSWELNVDQFTLRNPAWPAAIKDVLPNVHRELGLLCPLHSIRAEPYKLLLYEEGAFFKPHQDSEKTPGMFGTLVIALPSLHQGGDLSLRHNHEEVTIKTSTGSEFGFTWASWYSDVFHEVKPVTQGYRLMLTYNLASNPASGSGVLAIPPTLTTYVSQIKQLLHSWDAALEQNAYPDYLIYKFEHQYTLATLKLSRLNGSDRVRAECLKTAAAETGAAIFFATAEVEVIMDEGDYGDGGEIDRISRLKGVKTLDGTTIFDSLQCDDDKIINLEEFDEDSPDDEEHSGFTGNEGATATYWYRDTVCLVVPQAALDKFRFQGIYKWQWACNRLQESRQLPPPPDLVRLCNSLLRASRVVAAPNYMSLYSYGSRGPETLGQEACLKVIACIALEANQLDMFQTAFQRIKEPLPTESFYHLGRCLAQREFSEVDNLMYTVFRRCEGVASKYRSFEQLEQGVNGVSESLSQVTMDSWRRWFETSLPANVFEGAGVLTREDGAALSTIYSKISNEDHKTRILGQVSRGSMAGKIGFGINLAALVQGQHLDDAIARRTIRELLSSIWNPFSLGNANIAPGVEPVPVSESTHGKFPTGEDIVELVRLVGIYQDPSSPEPARGVAETTASTMPTNSWDSWNFTPNDCVGKIISACEFAGPMDIVGTFLPFIKLVVSNKVPFLLSPDDKQQPTELAKQIVQCTIKRFAQLVIGKQPEAPTTWAMRPVGDCPCADCTRVNTFLRSPTERIGRFPLSKARRHHLHTMFNDYRSSGADYAIETIRDCNPNIWQMTKKRGTYDLDITQWNSRARSAWPLLSQLLPKDQPTSKLLEEYMGTDIYHAIQTKNLPTLLAITHQTPPEGPLLTLSDTNAFGKRARPADGLAVPPTSAKRVASGDASSRTYSPVIDLTEE